MSIGWVPVLLVVLVVQAALILMALNKACNLLDRIANGTDPARIAGREHARRRDREERFG